MNRLLFIHQETCSHLPSAGFKQQHPHFQSRSSGDQWCPLPVHSGLQDSRSSICHVLCEFQLCREVSAENPQICSFSAPHWPKLAMYFPVSYFHRSLGCLPIYRVTWVSYLESGSFMIRTANGMLCAWEGEWGSEFTNLWEMAIRKEGMGRNAIDHVNLNSVACAPKNPCLPQKIDRKFMI